MGIKWFQLVDAAGAVIVDLHVASIDVPYVAVLRDAVQTKYASTHLDKTAPDDLAVYANRADFVAKRPLGPADSIESLGESPTDPLIVQTPPPFPSMAPLENAKQLRNECAAVPTWQPGIVHSIQHLHAFMKPLGGCTQHGTVYWREEEKQIATLLEGWFPASGGDMFADKRIILKGSPGVGKSTMFCLIAMYVATVKKKNVLVVRQVARAFYVFFVGHNGDQVVCFSKEKCKQQDAVNIYDRLKAQRAFSPVYLMLDGFVYKDIPTDLMASHLLATSQQVNLNSEDSAVTDSYLFPSWRSGDLFSLGKSIYKWSADVMNKRFYYSGGSVRDFTLEDTNKIEIVMLTVVNRVQNPVPLLSCSEVVFSGEDQIDRLRRTFVQREQVGNPLAYLKPKYWDQAVDSAFAITELQKKKRVGDKDIVSVYHWARARGSNSAALAGLLFELVIHHLAADNALQLSTTPYHKLESRKPDDQEPPVHTTDQNFQTIDSIVKLTDGGVAYLQMTVSKKHPVNVAFLKTLNVILGEEKPMFIVVCPTLKAVKRFVLSTRAVVEESSTVCDVHVAFYGDAWIDPKMDGPRNNVPLPSPPPPPPYKLRSRQAANGDHTLMQDATTLSSQTADGDDTLMQDATTLSSLDDDDESMDSISSSDDE